MHLVLNRRRGERRAGLEARDGRERQPAVEGRSGRDDDSVTGVVSGQRERHERASCPYAGNAEKTILTIPPLRAQT